MTISALLDTSFLISLMDSQRQHHGVARDYFRWFVQCGHPMYLSSIVAAEFCIRQPITDLPLGKLRTLSFNLTHGQRAAQLWRALGHRDAGDARAIVRDDVKLIAQVCKESIPVILTEDASTLYRYCERLRVAGQIRARAVKLIDGFNQHAISGSGQLDLLPTAMDQGTTAG